MQIKPIPFTAAMSARILSGDKTQTRRILKPMGKVPLSEFVATGRRVGEYGMVYELPVEKLRVPYAVGDLLWVREPYYQFGHWEPVDGVSTKGGRQKWAFVKCHNGVLFDMRGNHRLSRDLTNPNSRQWYARLARFMPRALSRTTLEVTGIFVQRLQDISRGDAMEEGCPFPNMAASPNPIDWFRDVWEGINGEGSWEVNPWCVAYSFRPIFQNVDAALKERGHA